MSEDAQENGEAPAVDNKVASEAEEGPKSKKRKPSKPTTLAQFTIRNPPWTYIHLVLITSSSLPGKSDSSSPDAISIHMHLRAALQQFLGLHGTAIPIDIMKHEGHDLWIRVPREDANAVVAAVGGWVGKSGEGWRVKGWSSWGPNVHDNGMDLFEEG